MFNIKKEISEDFYAFRRNIIYENIILCSKVLISIASFLVAIIDQIVIGKFNFNSCMLIVSYFFLYLICILIIKYKVIIKFEDWQVL